MLLMTKDLELNEEQKWLSHEEYYNYLKIIIKKNSHENNNDNNGDTIIKLIID